MGAQYCSVPLCCIPVVGINFKKSLRNALLRFEFFFLFILFSWLLFWETWILNMSSLEWFLKFSEILLSVWPQSFTLYRSDI